MIFLPGSVNSPSTILPLQPKSLHASHAKYTPSRWYVTYPPSPSINITELTFQQPLIEEAISYPNAPPTFHNVPKNQYAQVLDDRADFLDNYEIYISQLTGVREDLYTKLDELREILENITKHANQIMKRRYPPPQTEEAMAKQKERETIYGYMDDFMRTLSEEYDARHEKLDKLNGEIETLKEREGDLRVKIEAVGDMVGVGMEEVNGDMRDMERVVRLIDEAEAELEMNGGDVSGYYECF